MVDSLEAGTQRVLFWPAEGSPEPTQEDFRSLGGQVNEVRRVDAVTKVRVTLWM